MAELIGAAEIIEPVTRHAGRRLRPLWFVGLIPVGLASVYVGLGVLTDTTASVRGVLAIAGVLLAVVGIDAALQRLVDKDVETGFWLSVAWVLVVVLAAVFADVLPLEEARNQSKTLSEPSRARPDLFSSHPLGTDKLGLDMLGGVIYGARISLQVSLGAVALGTVVGGLIGVAAGYFRSWFDGFTGLFTDSLLAFPPLIFLLAVVSALDPTVFNISIALAFLGLPTYIRLARANTLSTAQTEYVLAAKALGAKNSRIVLRELVPNVVRPLLAYSFIIIAVLIVAEASLSFLGVGIKPPTPTWGNMISAGQTELETTPHLVFVPGIVMFLTVFALNRVGERLQRDTTRGSAL